MTTRAPAVLNIMTDLITMQMSCVILHRHRSNCQGDLYQHTHQEIPVLCRFQTESEDCLQLNSSVRPGHIFANSGRAGNEGALLRMTICRT